MSFSKQDNPSTRPYLLRALHEWCCDHGFTPYLAVQVDASVQVPFEYVKNGEIVLNVSVDSTSALRLGNDFIEFKARFGGEVRDIVVPVDHVKAIYARENGQGMSFPPLVPFGLASVPSTLDAADLAESSETEATVLQTPQPSTVLRTVLRAVPTEPKVDASPAGAGDDPEPPKVPPRGGVKRPTLKRIK